MLKRRAACRITCVGCGLGSLFSGCATVGYFESPWTLEPGQTELSISPPAVSVQVKGEEAVTVSGVSLRIRRGISPRADVGASLGGAGLGLETRYRVLESEDVVVTVSPSITGRPLTFALEPWQTQVFLPVSLGYEVTPQTQIVVSPGLARTSLRGASPQVASVLSTSLSLGVSQRFEGFSLQPGVAVTYELSGKDGYGGEWRNTFSLEQLRFGFGLSVGFGAR